MDKNYHNISFEAVAKILGVDPKKGLNNKEIKKRTLSFGKNIISNDNQDSALKTFLNQFKSPLIYILIFAGIITIFINKWADVIVIFLAVLINAFFGFYEEKKVSKILEKLKKTLKTKTFVIREGKKKEVLQENLVPGDVIILKAGEKVPADARIIFANELKVSEAILTGEWLAEDKISASIILDTPLADRQNMVYMGSLVENGTGTAIVVETGENTEAGKIACLIDDTREVKTPLQEKMFSFSKYLSIAIGGLCLLIFILGVFLRNQSWVDMFEASVAIAVGGIPESLPIVMTIILAIGTERILRKKGLIRKLSSVETLGSTQIICFDKTRTLTEGKMVLDSIISKNSDLAFEIAILANDAFLKENGEVSGSSTSKAILEGALKNKIDIEKLRNDFEEIQNLPFCSKNKYILSLRKRNSKRYLYICGAPEKVLENSKNNEKWKEAIESLTNQGLRVVAVGEKEIKRTSRDLNKIANNFNFIGLLSFKDPIRKDVKNSIQKCIDAGIRPILATGDHVLTAKNIALKIGIDADDENIMTGPELEQLTDSQFEQVINKIKVFARVEPKHKLRIVNIWQKKGKVIAMTGDGVNDAPAIKKADIGISLGSGTEVAKEASDLILLDDSFSTIEKTVEEGRVIIDNLRKSISYVLADSFTSLILIGLSTIVFGWPLPILPVQILWNNFIEDTFPTIALAFEPKENDVMKRKPMPRKAPLLTKEMKTLIFATGIIDQLFILFFFWFLYFNQGINLDYVRTLMFGMICVDTAFVVYAYKNLRKNIWQINPFSNKWLNLSSVFVLVSFALAVYLPPFQYLLNTQPIGFGGWGIILSTAFLSLAGIEATKHFFIKKNDTEN